MNILVLSDIRKLPDKLEFPIRVYPFLEYLKSQGHYITVITYRPKNTSEILIEKIKNSNKYYDNIVVVVKKNRYVSWVKGFIRNLFTHNSFRVERSNTKEFKKAIETELKNNNYNVIYAYEHDICNFLLKYKNYYTVADIGDSLAMNYEKRIEQEKSLLKKIFLKFEKYCLYNFEQKCVKKCNKIMCITEIDKSYIDKNNDKIIVVPNGVNINYFQNKSKQYKKYEIVYLGKMGYIQNHDACIYFIKSIYPLIKKQIPDVTFKIIGNNPKSELLELAKNDKSIVCTGYVDDVFDALKTAHVAVNPIRISSGLQNKILEEMSMGIPVVCSSRVAKNISLDEKIISVADSEIDFANKVCAILKDDTLRKMYSINGRKFIEDNFAWEKVVLQINKVLPDKLVG